MSSGMLWAAIGGGARAGAQVLDDQAKREDEDRRHARSLEDRKSALLFEMKAKADFARQEEDAAAEASSKIAERGAAIGNERGAVELEAARGMGPNAGEFANERITPEMIAAMPPQARAIYEREMGLTDDSPLQGMRDQVTASREIGAPATIRKGLLDSYNTELKSAKDLRDQERREKADQQRAERDERRLDQTDARDAQRLDIENRRADQRDRQLSQQMDVANRRIDAATRSGSGTIDQTEKLSVLKDVLGRAEASKPARKDYRNEKGYTEAVSNWEASNSGQAANKALSRINRILDGVDAPDVRAPTPTGAAKPASSPWIAEGVKAEQIRIIQSELAKDRAKGNASGVAAMERELIRLGAAPAKQPAARDNQAPVKGATTTKAEYMALPKGARYTAPDGTTRIKG